MRTATYIQPPTGKGLLVMNMQAIGQEKAKLEELYPKKQSKRIETAIKRTWLVSWTNTDERVDRFRIWLLSVNVGQFGTGSPGAVLIRLARYMRPGPPWRIFFFRHKYFVASHSRATPSSCRVLDSLSAWYVLAYCANYCPTVILMPC